MLIDSLNDTRVINISLCLPNIITGNLLKLCSLAAISMIANTCPDVCRRHLMNIYLFLHTSLSVLKMCNILVQLYKTYISVLLPVSVNRKVNL